jgi:hypothetical protein
MGRAGSHASRFEACINTVHAVITFDYFTDLRVPLGRAPGTCRNAGFTAHAQLVIHKDNAILFPPLHGTGGAGRHTPRVFAMETGHENVRCAGSAINEFGADFNYLAEFRLGRKRFITFTLNFTGMAADTFLLVLQHEIFTHYYPP